MPGPTADDDLATADGGDGKADGSPNVKWNAKIKNIVPKNVHEYLEKYQWGDYHIVFHMTRKWYLLGDSGRAAGSSKSVRRARISKKATRATGSSSSRCIAR